MAKRFTGKIAVDIRESEPDWGPYLAPRAPDGAPNVLMLAWDDLPKAAYSWFGGKPRPNEVAELLRLID